MSNAVIVSECFASREIPTYFTAEHSGVVTALFFQQFFPPHLSAKLLKETFCSRNFTYMGVSVISTASVVFIKYCR